MRSSRTVIHDGQTYEIIARQPALAPHPHPRYNGQLVQYGGITQVLAVDPADENRQRHGVECDECGVVFWADSDRQDDLVKAAMSVRGHMSSHADRGPLYPLETIRAVIRAVKTAERKTGPWNKCVFAAKDLNRRGITTYHGEKWTGTTVSQVYRRYVDTVRVRVSAPPANQQSQSGNGRKVDVESPLDPTQRQAEEIIRTFRDSIEAVSTIARALDRLTPYIERLEKQLAAATVDSEVAEKARRYDALRDLLP